MQIRSHKDLIVWQKSMELVVQSYEISHIFPDRERFGLISQLQRAAVSVPANIAEGHNRKSTGAFLNHLSIASGSLGELETHIEIGIKLKYVPRCECEAAMILLQEVRRMLDGLKQSLKRNPLDPNA